MHTEIFPINSYCKTLDRSGKPGPRYRLGVMAICTDRSRLGYKLGPRYKPGEI